MTEKERILPPGLILQLFFFIVLEDQTLQEKLPGYVEYTHRVRYRLFPGIW